jgi:hypothetical protein
MDRERDRDREREREREMDFRRSCKEPYSFRTPRITLKSDMVVSYYIDITISC